MWLSKINNFPWPWCLFSKRLGTYLHTTADCHSSRSAVPQTLLRRGLVRPDGKLRAAFSFLTPRRERGSWYMGWGNLNQQLLWDLEPLPLAHRQIWKEFWWPSKYRIWCYSFSSRIFERFILISHREDNNCCPWGFSHKSRQNSQMQ